MTGGSPEREQRFDADESLYGTELNAFLVEHAGQLPPGGKVMCLFEGEGRTEL